MSAGHPDLDVQYQWREGGLRTNCHHAVRHQRNNYLRSGIGQQLPGRQHQRDLHGAGQQRQHSQLFVRRDGHPGYGQPANDLPVEHHSVGLLAEWDNHYVSDTGCYGRLRYKRDGDVRAGLGFELPTRDEYRYLHRGRRLWTPDDVQLPRDYCAGHRKTARYLSEQHHAPHV
jgi:hypothetical protein